MGKCSVDRIGFIYCFFADGIKQTNSSSDEA